MLSNSGRAIKNIHEEVLTEALTLAGRVNSDKAKV